MAASVDIQRLGERRRMKASQSKNDDELIYVDRRRQLGTMGRATLTRAIAASASPSHRPARRALRRCRAPAEKSLKARRWFACRPPDDSRANRGRPPSHPSIRRPISRTVKVAHCLMRRDEAPSPGQTPGDCVSQHPLSRSVRARACVFNPRRPRFRRDPWVTVSPMAKAS